MYEGFIRVISRALPNLRDTRSLIISEVLIHRLIQSKDYLSTMRRDSQPVCYQFPLTWRLHELGIVQNFIDIKLFFCNYNSDLWKMKQSWRRLNL